MLIGNASYSIYLVHFYFQVIAAKYLMREWRMNGLHHVDLDAKSSPVV